MIRATNHMHLLISFSPFYRAHTSIFQSTPLLSAVRKNRHFSIHSSLSMESTVSEVARDHSPFFRIYKDGRIERLVGTDFVPPSVDPQTKVLSKDVLYGPEKGLSSRLYLPENTNPNQKLPLLVYYHGGGFCVETPFNAKYHNSLNKIVAEANVIAVSVDYRLAPEHPLPIAYDDSWSALKWVASHVKGDGPEEWLNRHANFGKVFFAGDSAGGNIAHQIALRYGQEKLAGIEVVGIALVHPYFWGVEPIGNESTDPEKRAIVGAIWPFVCPTTSGGDDPLINPVADPKLASLGCRKVLVLVAEKDVLRDRGWYYCEKLRESGWGGKVEIMEAKEEGHVFHLNNSACENAVAMLKRIASFINEDDSA